MNLILLEEKDKKIYNGFVAQQTSGSFLQSWEWGEWQEVLGREVKRFSFQDKSGEMAGVVQLVRMPLGLGRFYWYAPYGPILNSKFKIQNLKLLLKDVFGGAVFIRIEPTVDESLILNLKSLNKSVNIQPAKTLVVDLAKPDDQLLSEMHAKTRYNIKLAQRHGVLVEDEFAVSAGHGLYFDEALQLIMETASRQQFVTHGLEYYKQMVDFFALQKRGELKLHIYKSVYKKQLLSAAIMIDFGSTRTYLFGGSSHEHKEVMAPYALHWQAVRDARAAGLTRYDFWGIETASGETPGFVRFKLGFGGQQYEYPGAYDLVLQPLLYRMYGIMRAGNRLMRHRNRH